MNLSSPTLLYKIFLVICAVLAGCYFFAIKPDHNWGDDFALYLNQARSLVRNDIDSVIAMNKFALQHSSIKFFSPTLAPWGWPILLAPIIYVFGVIDYLISP